MMSRSSSAYQPLAQATASETATPAIPRRNYSGNATSVKIQGIVADHDDADDDDPMSHEVSVFPVFSGLSLSGCLWYLRVWPDPRFDKSAKPECSKLQ